MRLLRFLSSPRVSWYSGWTAAAARYFAKASSGNNDSGYGVDPLSYVLSQGEDDSGYTEESLNTGPLKRDQWAIILMLEAFDAKDQETLDKHQQRADSPESTVAPDCKEHAEIKAIKRLRYVIAKAHPESELQHKRCLVTDIPGYLEHVLGKDGKMLSTDAEVLSVWWKATVSAIEGNVSYYNH